MTTQSRPGPAPAGRGASEPIVTAGPGRARAIVLAMCALIGVGVLSQHLPVWAASPAVDRALEQFLGAPTREDAARLADAVVKAGAAFDDAYAALKRGRTYAPDAPKGIVKGSHRLGDTEFPYTVEVPDTYNPATRYQMRVQLHGGVGRPEATPRGNGIGQLAGAEQIYLLPTAWSEAEWWTDSQLENLRALVDRMKRTYNVDENRVVLSGVSDGGTGTYYVSMRDSTPFAAFLPLNGAIPVLRNRSMRVDGELFMHNMVNKPFFIVNGGLDPLYPTSLVEPYITNMQKGGVVVKYLPQPNAVHNTAWWPEVRDSYEAFVREHPRMPLPDTLSWESDLRAETGRAHWLVIDTVAPSAKNAPSLPDANEVVGTPVPSFGIQANTARVIAVEPGSNAASFGLPPDDVIEKIGPRVLPRGMDATDLLEIVEPGSPLVLTVTRGGASVELKSTYAPTPVARRMRFFQHAAASGRVDLTRSGNTVAATTRRVSAFTLLISPDQFDLSKPITVVADGKTVFQGSVKPDLATLLKWSARDNDRTMLFAAELKVLLDN